MMVLKMVPVKVKSVLPIRTPLPENAESDEEVRTRVCLNLQQPSRYSVFVASSGQLPTVAVGSSSTKARAYVPKTVNTFVHVSECEEQGDCIVRCKSDPGPFIADREQPCGRGTSAGSAPVPPTPSPILSRSTPTSSSSSDPTTISSVSSDINAAATVAISGEAPSARSDATARISSVIAVQDARIPSSGSAGHFVANGHCGNVCRFKNRHQHDPSVNTCGAGSLCVFCHEDHPKKNRKSANCIANKREARALARRSKS